MLRPRSVAMLFVLASLGTGACATYHDQLARGQRAFEQNDHDRTVALLRDLEPDLKHLTVQEQAHYAYLRGMSDYRIGYKPDARHWLAIAKAYEDTVPGVLPADWKARTNEALEELNEVVYTQGTSFLSTSRHADGDGEKANDAKDTTDTKKGRADVKTEPPTDAESAPSTPK
jgi:hypothetical protein